MSRILTVIGLLVWLNAAAAASLNGELDWANPLTLSVPFAAQVEQLGVQPGATVEAGQLVLQFDARVARAQQNRARSALKRTELQRAEAKREWDRAKELFDRTVLSVTELQAAEIGFVAADADYQAARADLVAADVTLEHHSLKAPYAAWVVATHVVPGEVVVNAQQATPLVTLAERGKLHAHAALDADQAAAVQPGSSAKVQVDDQQFPAQVIQVGIEPLSADRPALYPLVVEFTVPEDSRLRAGQAATIILP